MVINGPSTTENYSIYTHRLTDRPGDLHVLIEKKRKKFTITQKTV